MNHHTLVAILKQEAERYKLDVMKDDYKFVGKQLYKISYDLRKSVLRRYIDEWLKGVANEPNELAKQNTGRRKANLYLFELTE